MAVRDVFRFGNFTLDVDDRRLVRDGREVRLPPKAFDVLVALVCRAGRLVTKDELLSTVWPDAFVEEGILTVHISALRKALGDSPRAPRFIQTVPGSGYRWLVSASREHPHDHDALMRALPRPAELYEFVGRGRAHLLSASYFELGDALASFQAAIAIDATYAPAHAGLALTRCAQAALRAVAHAEAYGEAKSAALRALAMDIACADAQVALGTVLFLGEWEWRAAERSFQRALALSAGHTEALLKYGSLLEALGRVEEGLQVKQQALARDQQSPMVFVQIASAHWHARRYDEAVAWARRALAVDARHLLAGEFLAGVYWMRGDLDAFLAENLRRAVVFGAPDDSRLQRMIAAMREAHASGGLAALARAMLCALPARAANVQRAVLFGAAGELDGAFAALDRALADRDPALVHLAVAPQWDSLRHDPRFADRLRQMRLTVGT